MVSSSPALCFGCGHSRLGGLAAVAGEWECSAAHFERALEWTREVGATMPRLEAMTYYALSLTRRARAEDAVRVGFLAKEARAEAQALGLEMFVRQADAALSRLGV